MVFLVLSRYAAKLSCATEALDDGKVNKLIASLSRAEMDAWMGNVENDEGDGLEKRRSREGVSVGGGSG
jgi:hypothetical protein